MLQGQEPAEAGLGMPFPGGTHLDRTAGCATPDRRDVVGAPRREHEHRRLAQLTALRHTRERRNVAVTDRTGARPHEVDDGRSACAEGVEPDGAAVGIGQVQVGQPAPDLRLEDVARQVGVSRAKLYYYFAGVDDLRAFLVEQHLTEGARVLATAAGRDGTARDRLHAAIAAAVEHLAPRPGLCAGVLGGSGADPTARALARTDAVVAAPLRGLIAAGVEDGSLATTDVDATVDSILGSVLLAVLGRWRRGRTDDADAFAQGVADRLLEGLSTRQ